MLGRPQNTGKIVNERVAQTGVEYSLLRKLSGEISHRAYQFISINRQAKVRGAISASTCLIRSQHKLIFLNGSFKRKIAPALCAMSKQGTRYFFTFDTGYLEFQSPGTFSGSTHNRVGAGIFSYQTC